MTGDDQPTSRGSRIDPIALVVVAIVAILAAIGGLVLVARSSHEAQTAAAVVHHMEPSHVTPHARHGQIVIDVGDFWFKPSTHRIHAGVYTFTARNYGGTQHDVMVERTPIKMMGPGQPIDEAAPYGVDGLQPGMTKTTTVMLGAGRWEVFCSVGGHYQAGQHQIITVYGHMPAGMRVPRSMGMDENGGMGMSGSSGHMSGSGAGTMMGRS